ncbi:Zn-dependent hydrolase [Alteribacillus bidgolensis]|uniref:Allantoate deiminase n=1 Tax=Alteribacillus bidgolensis TaxID=930129 RepID=A0A1G8KCE1_9BACI|nr:Zn-dependent hydrolase [Alteribacillus bidgolensis]SDI40520.1 allantoate deiminase [Alteribacillus bidgolensis]
MNVFSKKRLLASNDNLALTESLNPGILADRLASLAEIGKTEDGGVTRYVYTEEEADAKKLFRSWMENAGLKVREDAVGNMYGRLEGKEPELPALLTGSHLDTVPNGGAFDGSLGCVSSLMAIEAIIQEHGQLRRSLELVVFADEEGARFGSGLFGSRAAMGEVSKEDLFQLRDENGVTAAEAMKRQGYAPNKLKKCVYPKEEIHAFLELHIEQGKSLEQQQKNIGIVNGIAGPSWLEVIFEGETDHAGNTPMDMRSDAAAGAADLVLSIENIPREISSTAVATVGKLQLFPNGSNVIAGKAEMTVDVRDIDEEVRDNMLIEIKREAERIAEKRGLKTETKIQIKIPPVPVPKWIQQHAQEAAEKLKLSYNYLPSGAGHDAMIAGKYVPSGLIFVPSYQGKSHSPEEFTSLKDCFNGVLALKEIAENIGNDNGQS